MKNNYYITSDGILKRKENTVYFINKNGKRAIPINKIDQIHAFGSISFSSGVVKLLAKYGVIIHFYNRYNFYIGSFYPKETLLSGSMIVKQAEFYLNNKSRLEIAKKLVYGAVANITKNLERYNLSGKADEIAQVISSLETCGSIADVMNVEGRCREIYYSCFNTILKNFSFTQRKRRPPNNEINALISFGNSLLYGTTISEIYRTQLNPTISFLHEPFERRFSLALDISEIFKPLIVDRLIFKLVNQKVITADSFDKELNSCLLNDYGRKAFLKAYDEKLSTTIKHKNLKRKVSYQRLIRLECYKLQKHLLGLKEYDPFQMWW